jgi:hypothetical protein
MGNAYYIFLEEEFVPSGSTKKKCSCQILYENECFRIEKQKVWHGIIGFQNIWIPTGKLG